MNTTSISVFDELMSAINEEHRAARIFIERLRKFTAHTRHDRVEKYITWYWKEHIRPHFQLEEQVFIPLLPPAHPLLARMEDEHAEIMELLIGLSHDFEDATVALFCSQIERHIRFEEEQFFPYVQQLWNNGQLGDPDWKKSLASVPTTEWPDAFWS